ncbi:MAG: pentapeptide repeat-containing protein [Nostocaceae cyanobacterium]|nr:pentapeptide repeat-containing protein [Nostocaceae cyanobacterium]
MNNKQLKVLPQQLMHFKNSVCNNQQAAEIIYAHLIKIVKDWSPESTLAEFRNLFIYPNNGVNSPLVNVIYNLAFDNNEQEFITILKRSCYILINNWCVSRKLQFVQQLVTIFCEVKIHNYKSSLALTRLQKWLNNFIKSQDYQDIVLFAAAHINDASKTQSSWSNRYAAYLLAPQYMDTNNPIEQREAAKELAKQIKEKFKLDLAMYTAHSHAAARKDSIHKNPTQLGDEALGLIKRILLQRGLFSYTNLAHIFIEQNQQVTYSQFKHNLHKYLIASLSLGEENIVRKVWLELDNKLNCLYDNYDEDIINDNLTLRTCNHTIDYLTTENRQEPSPLFLLFLAQGERLSLVIILLKIVLICMNARAHLEAQIGNLIRYYETYPETECRGVIHFLEVFNIAFTMYTEDVEYNLVHVNQPHTAENGIPKLDAYRIFSQLKYDLNLAGADLRHRDLYGVDLSNVNLGGADLSSANLSSADLSGVNLSKANLNNANLNKAELITANMQNANLSNANLQGADLRRANLSGANLREANLTNAKLRLADLSNADLQRSNLGGANLNSASLRNADLRRSRLHHADLTNADLLNANLSNAELGNVNLSGADLSGADLSGANLRYVSLMDAKLCNCNLTGVNLGHANLSGADLSNTNFSEAKLLHARLGNNLGISDQQKQRLQQQGAIVEE